MIRSMFLAAVSTVVLGTVAAMAADLPAEKGPPVYAPPPPPVFSWSGFYIGGQVGYQWSRASSVTTEAFGFPVSVVNPTANGSGVNGGGHLGYNYQISQFVIGIEGDANASSIRSSEFDPATGYSGYGREDFDASIRARAGVVFDRVLIYATGGGAYGDFRIGVTDPFGFSEAHNAGHIGWTVGGGAEYAIDNNWSVRAEYRYTDYGSFGVGYTTLFGAPLFVRNHITDNRVQAGFSYRFGEAPPPAPPLVTKY